MTSDNRMLERNVKALITCKLIPTFPGVIFTRKYNRTKLEKSICLQKSMSIYSLARFVITDAQVW